MIGTFVKDLKNLSGQLLYYAIIIVVSEETGEISIAQGGDIRQHLDPVRLQQTLQRYLTINSRKRARAKKEIAE